MNSNDLNITEPVSPARAVGDLIDLARQRAIDGDYWTPGEYRKAIAAYNRAVEAYRRQHPDEVA